MSQEISPGTRSGDADIIFSGGSIVTVTDDKSAAPEAVAVKDGRIVFVGSLSQAQTEWRGPDTRLHALLPDQALLPGFIDAHGHVTGAGLQATIANLLAAPDGDVTDIASLQDKLREFAESEVGERSDWIIGFGYDDSMLAGGKHPTRDDLDAVSTEKPVLAIHQSFHLGAVNSLGLERLEYTATTPDPEGGVIRRRLERAAESGPVYGEPNGVLEETAFNPAADLAIAGMDPVDSGQFLPMGLLSAASFGFTTVQEGAASLEVLGLMRQVADAYPTGLPTDVVVYVKADQAMKSPEAVLASRKYSKGLRAAGVKLILDGSPQGRTAWLTEPYLTPPDGKDEEYRGYAALSDKDVLAQVRAGFANDWHVIAHVNGDAAIDQLIQCVRSATKEAGQDRRTTAIHCQTAREDQIEAFRELGIIPSFFSMHTYYWGDWYRKTVLGPERAVDISPARWAVDRGMAYTSHHDAPVALPNSIAILSSQVTRVTRTSGSVLGPDQCVSALDAVKSITINAARQYFEEDTKGSIEVGKLADLVILSHNPLTIPERKIKDITVVETIKEGRTVYPPSTTHPHPAPVPRKAMSAAAFAHC
ncbi:amidohydrolase [Streptomyces rishiriensis]|uniref:amidohydrolase n=1 Tax=Streptomyces rishiriensis TaxID=68264 RepID=UPI0033D0146A